MKAVIYARYSSDNQREPEVNGYYDEQGNFVLAQGESLDSLTQTYLLCFYWG